MECPPFYGSGGGQPSAAFYLVIGAMATITVEDGICDLRRFKGSKAVIQLGDGSCAMIEEVTALCLSEKLMAAWLIDIHWAAARSPSARGLFLLDHDFVILQEAIGTGGAESAGTHRQALRIHPRAAG